jgi:hypothetical protein
MEKDNKEQQKFVQDIFNAFQQDSSLITEEQKKLCKRVQGIEQSNEAYRQQINTLQTYLTKNAGKVELLVEDIVSTMPKPVEEKVEVVEEPEVEEKEQVDGTK